MVKSYDSYNQGHTVAVALATAVNLHTSGDTIGGLITVTKALGTNWHGCELRGVTLIDAGAKANACSLRLFRQLPSTIVDDAAWTPVIADVLMFPGGHKATAINAGDWETITTSDEGTISVASKNLLNVGLDLRGGTPSTFYAYLIDDAGLTPVATDDWTLLFHFWID